MSSTKHHPLSNHERKIVFTAKSFVPRDTFQYETGDAIGLGAWSARENMIVAHGGQKI
jgi:hypothetical protein